MRDIHKDEAFFEEQIEEYKIDIFEVKDELKNIDFTTLKTTTEEAYTRITNFSLFLKTLNLLKCQYSIGESITTIRVIYLEAIEFMENAWKKEEFNGFYTVDDYWDMLSMLSLGYILEVEKEKLDHLIKLRYVIDKPDFLLDALCNTIQGKPVTNDKSYMKEGNRYLSLYDVIQASSKEEATKLLLKYVKSDWYKKTQANSWHGSHNKKSYVGYWSFESAAIVKMLGLDDSSFKDLKYYPYDLLHQSK